MQLHEPYEFLLVLCLGQGGDCIKLHRLRIHFSVIMGTFRSLDHATETLDRDFSATGLLYARY